MADNTVKCSCYEALENKKKEVEEESFATTILKEYVKSSKRWFIIAMIVLVCWLSTIAGFVWYLNQYDYSSVVYEVSAAQDGEGINNMSDIGEFIYGAESTSESQGS